MPYIGFMLRLAVLLLLLAGPAWAGGASAPAPAGGGAAATKPPASNSPVIPFAPAQPGSPLPMTSGTGTAVEGDLVSVNGAVVKLWGIDAPDSGQTCQTKANQPYDCFTLSKDQLSNYIGQNQVTCWIRGKDRNGQSLGTCGVNGLDLAALMVRNGWALAYRDLSPQYLELEAFAQTRVRGLWAGRVEPPWQYRTRMAALRNK